MNTIIIPGEEKSKFLFGKLIGYESEAPTAMVKFPASLADVFGGVPDDESEEVLIWLMMNQTDERADDMKVTRYEFHGLMRNKTDEPAANFNELDTIANGYVYMPKDTRDGRHEEAYYVVLIDEEEFTTRTSRGMYEEMAWSPFGSAMEAVKQEATNLDRNPLMRNWK